MKRILSPATNPAGLTSLAAALYALGFGIWNVTQHRGAVDPQVIVAALAAVAALFTRQVVTPVTDPHDGAGRPLSPGPSAGLSGMNIEQIAAALAMSLPQPSAPRRPPAAEPLPPVDPGAFVAQFDDPRLRQPAATPDVQPSSDPREPASEYRAAPMPVPSSDPRERAAQ